MRGVDGVFSFRLNGANDFSGNDRQVIVAGEAEKIASLAHFARASAVCACGFGK
jgi:hypothetical protein